MKPKSIAIVGAAETTRLGVIPDMSQIQLHADAALNAMADAGLKPADIDGIATAGETPVTVAHYLGLTPKWVDGTAVGGCSFMIHLRHAAAAIASGLCETVLITHGESGRSGVARTRNIVAPTSLAGHFEQPYGPMGPPTHRQSDRGKEPRLLKREKLQVEGMFEPMHLWRFDVYRGHHQLVIDQEPRVRERD